MVTKEILKRLIIEFHQTELPELVSREKYFPVLKTRKIISVIGPRRSGKTYFLYQIIKELQEEGVDRKKIIYINFDDSRLFPLDKDTLDLFQESYFELYPELVNEQIYVFLDEIQNVAQWEHFVRRLHEADKAKIFVSGSSSKMLSKEVATSLRGRTLPHVILPFSFKEFLLAKRLIPKRHSLYGPERYKIKKYFMEYLEFGGFPEIVLEEDKNVKIRILQEYLNVMMYRDIIERYSVRNIKLLRYIIKYLLTNTSTYLTISSLYKAIKPRYSVSKTTIDDYITYLEDTMLIFLVSRYAYSLKMQERFPQKVYVVDTGLRNANCFLFSEDYGRLAENIVFLELFRDTLRDPQLNVFFWKDKKQHEVDFLVTKKEKVDKAIQVCWDVTDEMTKKREEQGLLSALEEFDLDRGYILTEDYTYEKSINGKSIVYLPIWYWLLDKSDFDN
ncbi:MAG: ATP-binding protein [Candidatus Asgardarchaeia archaeon]